MAGVKKCIQLGTSPLQVDNEASLERIGDSLKRTQAHRGDPTALDQRHKTMRDAGLAGEVNLPPALAQAKNTELAAESSRYRAMMRMTAYRGLRAGLA